MTEQERLREELGEIAKQLMLAASKEDDITCILFCRNLMDFVDNNFIPRKDVEGIKIDTSCASLYEPDDRMPISDHNKMISNLLKND